MIGAQDGRADPAAQPPSGPHACDRIAAVQSESARSGYSPRDHTNATTITNAHMPVSADQLSCDGATCAFMLPVGTPPNAIVYGSGDVRMACMVRNGVLLSGLGVVLIVAFSMTLVPTLMPA